jgi:hypothetical protein
MADEYTQHLEEEIADLEAEADILTMEIERLQEKLDGVEEAMETKYRTLSEENVRKALSELHETLGITKISTDDPVIWAAAIKVQLTKLRVEADAAKAKYSHPTDRVRIAIPGPRRQEMYPISYHGKDYYYAGRPYEEEFRYCDYTTTDLAKKFQSAMDALAFVTDRLADQSPKNYRDDTRQHKQLRQMLAERFHLSEIEFWREGY